MQSPVIRELNYLQFYFETEVQDDTHCSLVFCILPLSHLAPAHTICSSSFVIIYMVQKSCPKMMPHGQFLSSFQNCLCGLILHQRWNHLLLQDCPVHEGWRACLWCHTLQISRTLLTGFVLPQCYKSEVHNGVEEILQPKTSC